MDFEKNGHGKSWKSHGILNGRCTNPVYRFSGYETGTTGCFLLGLTTFETCQLVDLSSIIEETKWLSTHLM
jgi:hypothetical protein